jgi:hypothetical protein
MTNRKVAKEKVETCINTGILWVNSMNIVYFLSKEGLYSFLELNNIIKKRYTHPQPIHFFFQKSNFIEVEI